MTAEEKHGTENGIALRRPRKQAEPAAARSAVPDAARAAKTPPATVLNAARGIINTGLVHGGQHVTTVEFGRCDGGAGDDV
nr:S-type pyocin domain-containing protein [Streptomyces harenosi]